MSVAAVTGPLLERSDELAQIESALTDARLGRGRLVVVEGPAGIGKTALLDAARTVSAASGMRVLRARGTELEREFAFGVVRQLFEPALAEASEPDRADLLHGAAGVAATLLGLPGAALADGAQGSAVDPSFAILHGLYWLSANLAGGHPLCLAVDDAHWADGPSLRFLTFLLTRLEELNVALVVATRLRDVGADAELLATLTSSPSAEVVSPAPLTRAAVARLVEAALDGASEPAFVDACLAATGGMPFLLRELVGALREGGIAPTAEAARHVERVGARSVARSVQLRLRRLPEGAGRLARALAVLEQSDLHRAARLAQLDDTEAAAAAELLASAGILDSGLPLTFVHPIVRNGIYIELSGAERTHAHRRAAHLLAEQAGTSERVAQHLLITEPGGDAWVFGRLVEAARAAGQQGAHETEAVFLRRALAEPAPPDHRSRLLLDLGMAEANAGLPGWPEHLRRAIEAAPDAAAATDAAMVLGLALSRAQHFAEAVDLLDDASSAVDPHDDSEVALVLEAAAVSAGINDLRTASSIVHRRARLRELADGHPSPPPELLAAAALISVLTNEPAVVGADLAIRALRKGGIAAGSAEGTPWFTSTTWFSQTTTTLLWVESYAQLRPLLDASISQARATGDGSRLAVGLAHRGWLAVRRGDLGAAESDARTALAAATLPAPALYRVLNGGVLVEALVEGGDLLAAEQALAPLESEAEGGSLAAEVLRLARGRLRVQQGRFAEGLEDFLAVGARLTRAEVTCSSYLPWRSEAALAHLALGDPELARKLAEEELDLARTFGAPRALGVAKRAAGLAVGGDQGELLLREAVEAFERSGASLERARILADLGAVLRRRNRRSEARELLRESLDGAHRLGARRLARRAETELRATGARPRRVVLSGLDSLTASERRIAELASQSLTNREIAQLLFITDRTVEGHLTSVFRKLQLDSRTALLAALGDGPAEAAPVAAGAPKSSYPRAQGRERQTPS